MTGAEGIDHTPAVDYEYIDDVKPSLPSLDMFVNSINDYSRTPHPFEMSTYEVPVQSTMSKVCTHYTNSLFVFDGKENIDPILFGKAQTLFFNSTSV